MPLGSYPTAVRKIIGRTVDRKGRSQVGLQVSRFDDLTRVAKWADGRRKPAQYPAVTVRSSRSVVQADLQVILSDDVGQAELVDEHTILNCEQDSATAQCSIEVSVEKLQSINAKSQAESERLRAIGLAKRFHSRVSLVMTVQKGEGANRALDKDSHYQLHILSYPPPSARGDHQVGSCFVELHALRYCEGARTLALSGINLQHLGTTILHFGRKIFDPGLMLSRNDCQYIQ